MSIDYSAFDFAEDFDQNDAAALIAGLDPFKKFENKIVGFKRAEPIVRRMMGAVEKAFRAEARGEPFPVDSLMLISVEQRVSSTVKQSWKGLAGEIIFSDDDEYRIRRDEIARWLSAIGIKSKYQFGRELPTDIEQAKGRWPWGNHHTELLGHLEAAAKRFWVSYDPMDATTANTNVTVIEWLQSERKVSGKMAEAIATMLRPDGLPTGPRK